MSESKRIRKLRDEMVQELPKFPNNRETKVTLESKPLPSLIIDYLNWRLRFVTARPRKITILPAVTADRRWKQLRTSIQNLLDEARRGNDLTPYLSLAIHTAGYTPAASSAAPDVDRWADKDFLLNVMGLHHFHIGEFREAKGHIARTDELLFVRVSREVFTAIGIFDHSVFDASDPKMSIERQRLWNSYDEYTGLGAPEGSLIMPPPIVMSGHPFHLVTTAQQYSKMIQQYDPKLDDRGFIYELFDKHKIGPPTNPRFEWVVDTSGLKFYEAKTRSAFLLLHGFS